MRKTRHCLAAALTIFGAHGLAQAQAVTGLCDPSFTDLGAFDTHGVSVSVPVQVDCKPERPLVVDPTSGVPSEGVTPYAFSIQFELLSEGSFSGYLSPSNPIYLFQRDDGTFVSRISTTSYGVSILYEDAFVASATCGGCAGGRPSLINSAFFAESIPGSAPGAVFAPAGTYRIDTTTLILTGNVPERTFRTTLDIRTQGTAVTPVPEPATWAMQAVGLVLLLGVVFSLKRPGKMRANASELKSCAQG